jgi:hypothetical protein
MDKIKLKGFLSYARSNSEYSKLFLKGVRDQLKHSKSLELEIWDDSNISLGTNWLETITKQIEKSDFAILLVSSDFLSSEFIENVEFLSFIKRQKDEGFRFYTVFLSPCDISQWEQLSETQFFFPRGIDYGFPKEDMIYYGELVKHNKAGLVLSNVQREKFHANFAKELEKTLVSDFTNKKNVEVSRIKLKSTTPRASVKAVKKFHSKSSLEQYISDFEEATGFEDYVVELKDSRYHPKEIIPEIYTSFDFLGHGASKWTDQFVLLDQAIERVKRNKGMVRFMTFDPRVAKGLKDHEVESNDIQEQNKILKSLLTLKHLANKHLRDDNKVQIKIYRELPTFRLAFVNSNIVLVGHYNGHTRNSNESPIIVFNSVKEWSFYSAFRALFEKRWNEAETIDTAWQELQSMCVDRGIVSPIN